MTALCVALPHNVYWSPARRSLVRVNPGLVAAADRSRYYPKSGWHSSDEVVDCQKFIIAGGSELYLIAGLLGLGIGYLLTHHSRLPRETEPVRVFPLEGRPFTGPWRGMADNGDLLVGNRQFDHDQLVMAERKWTAVRGSQQRLGRPRRASATAKSPRQKWVRTQKRRKEMIDWDKFFDLIPTKR